MPRLWRLATRNWWDSRGRTLACALSVALGVGIVVTVTSVYETARRAITQEVVSHWLGAAHLSIQPAGAHWGTLEASFAGGVAELENVRQVTARLVRRVVFQRVGKSDQLFGEEAFWVDAVGIDPLTEQNFRSFPSLEGQMLVAGQRGAAVMEKQVARDWNVDVGDSIELAMHRGGSPLMLKVIGLFDSQRVADFQRPQVLAAIEDVQALAGQPGAASAIDAMLLDPSPAALEAGRLALERLIAERGLSHAYKVETAAARQMLLDEAQRITHLVLMVSAVVALLTSFFIILTTMSMSLFARSAVLGAMRCVGVTRGQMAGLLVLELLPLGLAGTVLGVGGGVGVIRMLPVLEVTAFPWIEASPWGIGLAVIGGIGTTIVCCAVLMFQVCRVSPLAAVNPQARPARRRLALVSGGAGIALIVLHEWILANVDPTRWMRATFLSIGAGSLYFGYVLLAPALVVLIGPVAARAVGPLLGLPAKLARDQLGKAPWRSTGVCWVLMVGLSLIVFLATRASLIRSIWDFPGRLPESFVWSREYVAGDVIDRVRKLPGVGQTTVVADVDCDLRADSAPPVKKRDSIVDAFLRKLTRPVFVAGDPEALLGMLKVAFTQGAANEAKEKLARGGYVLIPTQAAAYHGLTLGDHVTITVGDRSAEFEIAGVIQSPALDIAVTAFQATSYMQFAAASAMLGTRADLKEKLGLDVVSMFMCNLDLPPVPPPPDFHLADSPDYRSDETIAKLILSWSDDLPNERATMDRIREPLQAWLAEPGRPLAPELRAELLRFGRALRRLEDDWHDQTPEQNWAQFREGLVLVRIAQEMGRPDAIIGSLRRLKESVDRTLQRSTLAITWLPSLMLAVAAIGIGNLMMVSVRVRARQIAMLRALGAVKSQIVRLVLSEAASLGLVGSVIGVALGLHQAFTDNRVAGGLLGIHPEYLVPVTTILLAVSLTVAVCLLAGIGPARHASRDNIAAAMQAT